MKKREKLDERGAQVFRLESKLWTKSKKRKKRKALDERDAWLSRPRVDYIMLEELSELANPLLSVDQPRKRPEFAKELGWSYERFMGFKQFAVNYHKNPTMENYLSVRRNFPELEVQICRYGGPNGAIFDVEKELNKHCIDMKLLNSALYGEEPEIDAFCLYLMERLVERDNIPSGGTGHIQKRRSAISDAVINYLLSVLLERYDEMAERTSEISERDSLLHMPTSLSVLVREQLCGPNSDLYAASLSKKRRDDALHLAAEHLLRGEKMTVRRLMQITGASRMTAARWLREPDFREELQDAVARRKRQINWR